MVVGVVVMGVNLGVVQSDAGSISSSMTTTSSVTVG